MFKIIKDRVNSRIISNEINMMGRFGIQRRLPMVFYAYKIYLCLKFFLEHRHETLYSVYLEIVPLGFEIVFEKSCCFILIGRNGIFLLNDKEVNSNKLYNVVSGDVLRIFGLKNSRFLGLGIFDTIYNSSLFLSELVYDGFNDEYIYICKGDAWRFLSEESKFIFLNSYFDVSNDSNRMGFKLSGNKLEMIKKKELVSSGVAVGSIQLLPNGQCIVLMSDSQVSGGYPIIGHICNSSLSCLAQKVVGCKFRFKMISVEESEEMVIKEDLTFKRLLASLSI